MSQSTFSIRMEDNLKAQFEGLCDSFGMNMNTAFNVFARAVVRERRITFEICEGNKQITREGALAAFDAIRAKAIQDGVADMSLEEINAEIAKVRHGEIIILDHFEMEKQKQEARRKKTRSHS